MDSPSCRWWSVGIDCRDCSQRLFQCWYPWWSWCWTKRWKTFLIFSLIHCKLLLINTRNIFSLDGVLCLTHFLKFKSTNLQTFRIDFTLLCNRKTHQNMSRTRFITASNIINFSRRFDGRQLGGMMWINKRFTNFKLISTRAPFSERSRFLGAVIKRWKMLISFIAL